jgi:hypothetical protein
MSTKTEEIEIPHPPEIMAQHILTHSLAALGEAPPEELVRRAFAIATACEKHTQKYWVELTLRNEAIGIADLKLENSLRPQVFAAQKQCAYCDESLNGNGTIDHIEPLILGGLSQLPNLAAACGKCNSSKGSKSLWDWITPFPTPKKNAIIRGLLKLKKKLPTGLAEHDWAMQLQIAAENESNEHGKS